MNSQPSSLRLQLLVQHPEVLRRRQVYLETVSQCPRVRVFPHGWECLDARGRVVSVGLWTRPEECNEFLEDYYFGVRHSPREMP